MLMGDLLVIGKLVNIVIYVKSVILEIPSGFNVLDLFAIWCYNKHPCFLFEEKSIVW